MTNEELVKRIQRKENVENNMLTLWRQNQGLITKIACRYSMYEDMEDLRQQGYIGLYSAVVNYDQNAGALFSTYATLWIRQSIKRYVDECGSLVRVPCGLMGVLSKYKKLTSYMMANYGRKPTDKEAMQYLGITAEQMERLHEALRTRNIKSLNTPINEDNEETELIELIKDKANAEMEVLDRLEHGELKRILWEIVAGLPKEQSHVIIERYKNQRTLADISRETGETPSQTRRKELKALDTMSRCKGSTRLRSFLPESYNLIRGTGVNNFKRTWTSVTERTAIDLYDRSENLNNR
jgi:RNA polymerase primary sigma factor